MMTRMMTRMVTRMMMREVRGESARGWEISHRLYTQTLESNCIRTG